MRISYTFSKRTQRREVKVTCKLCGKSRKRAVSTFYYANGMHDERKTLLENNKWLDKECKRLAKEGITCATCEKATEAALAAKAKKGTK